MRIHFKGPLQEFGKVFKSNGTCNGQADGRPEGITSANPVPEFKHIVCVNAELLNLFLIGGDGHEVF